LMYFKTANPLIEGTGGAEGVYLARASLAREDYEYWNGQLYPLVAIRRQTDTLCYLVPEKQDRAALMYRTSGVAGRGEAVLHVPIGPRQELTPKRALGSLKWDWDGAKKQPGLGEKALRKVDGANLASFLTQAQAGWAEVTAGSRPSGLNRLIINIRD